MKTSTLRLVVILAAFSIIGITITQVYWVRKAFDLQQGDFDREVNTALLTVAQHFFKINNTPSPANNPVVRVSTNYYAVMLNSDINANVLEFLLKTEFEKRNIKADFEYGIYDCSQERMIYGKQVFGKQLSINSAKPELSLASLPPLPNASYYFGVRFPGREVQLVNQMGIWTFSSVVLLVVIIFFVYALFVIFKQKRLSEVQKDFINNMTHEFKTPLSTISLSAEVFRQQALHPQPERMLNYATIIEQETNRMRQHLERMLQVARFDRADIQLKKESLDIHQLIRETVDSLQPLLADKRASVVYSFQCNSAAVQGDKHHLANVIFNLLDNALKYSINQPEVTITTRQQPKGMLIEVKDSGIGISHEHQKKVFQKFYRVPTGNVHNVKGFGLGLSYVKQVVEAHLGNISLKSEINAGSLFIVYLPLSV